MRLAALTTAFGAKAPAFSALLDSQAKANYDACELAFFRSLRGDGRGAVFAVELESTQNTYKMQWNKRRELSD